MNGTQDFQVREIKQEQVPVSVTPPEKKGGGLISLFNKKNLPKTLIVILILVIFIAVGAIFWGRHSFSKAKVEIDIEVPKEIASGEEISLIIKYENNNRVDLGDAYLIIDYPLGTFSLEGKEIFQEEEKLGTILHKSEGEKEFRVRFVGEEGSAKNLVAKLNYQPQNINSRFENSALFRIEINSVLIGIDIEGSEETISGQEVSYLIEYENKTDDDISDLKMELSYSDDFEFKTAEPNPIEEDNIWQIGLLKSGQKETIDLKGILRGEERENKILKATIGRTENDIFLQYSQKEFITQISPSPLLLLLELQGIGDKCNVDSGERLNYKIEFKNNTDIALVELVLKVHLNNKVFDFQTLDLDEGFFDSRQGVITWSGADVSALSLLEPNQSDEVIFSVKIRDPLMFSYNDKNLQARILAEIETLAVPAKFSISELRVEKELLCRINSQLVLQTKGYYYEPGTEITNTGPIPPKVDQLTTYTIHWQIFNSSNDVENVRIWSILPQGKDWSDNYSNKVSDSQFYYNERTKELIWQINKLPAGTGIIFPTYELVFQVGLRPSVNQIGQTPTLINESSIEGKDSFTKVILKDFSAIVDSALPHDPKIGIGQGKVVE